jgi:hypothetical protein
MISPLHAGHLVPPPLRKRQECLQGLATRAFLMLLWPPGGVLADLTHSVWRKKKIICLRSLEIMTTFIKVNGWSLVLWQQEFYFPTGSRLWDEIWGSEKLKFLQHDARGAKFQRLKRSKWEKQRPCTAFANFSECSGTGTEYLFHSAVYNLEPLTLQEKIGFRRIRKDEEGKWHMACDSKSQDQAGNYDINTFAILLSHW